jgi:uncharacterized membrane protein YGL010W
MAPLFVLLEGAFAAGVNPDLAETVEKEAAAKRAEMDAPSSKTKSS